MTVLNFPKQPGRSFLSGAKVMTKPKTGFAENLAAGFSEARALQPIEPIRFERDWWAGVNQQIKEQTGESFPNPVPFTMERRGYYNHQVDRIRRFVQDNKDRLRLGHPDEPGGSNMLMLDPDTFSLRMGELARENAKADIDDAEEVYGRSSGGLATAAQYAGAFGGAATDPFNLGVSLTMAPLSGGSSLLLNTVLREAMINMTAEVVQQPAVAQYYASLDLPYDFATFRNAVITATVVGGAFPFAIRGGTETVRLTAQQMQKFSNVLFDAGVKKSDVAKGAELQLDVEVAQAADNPLSDTPQGKLEHKQREAAGIVAAETLEPPAITELPAAPVKAPLLREEEINLEFDKLADEGKIVDTKIAEAMDELNNLSDRGLMKDGVPELEELRTRISNLQNQRTKIENGKNALGEQLEQLKQKESSAPVADADNLDNFVYKFKPGDIQVDAKLFQFKEGGDEFGVTPEYQGVTQWDPSLAGQIAVYEFADGSQFIADGHQRLGLARRIMAKDPSQNITLYGTKIRQVDGVTPEEAMVRAAMANIVNGKGTIFDAVKIARIAPEKFNSPSIKQNAAFVRRAKELVRLSDEAYGLALNGIVPDNYAAIVGRLVDDPDMQLAVMNVLAQVKPGNEFQAETITRQIMNAGLTTETTADLFGEQAIASALYLERAKILDAAVTRLKKDKSAFAQVTKNQARLEDEGNQLATENNKKRLLEDGQAIQILQTQANRKGTLSDELTEAARLAKTTGKYGEATDSFVESVRRSVDSGDFLGTDDGNVGRALDDQAQDSAAPNETELLDVDKFDDAFGEGAENQGNAIVDDIRNDPAFSKPERDMFDTGDNIQPGDRQVDLEELIANKADDEQAALRKVVEEDNTPLEKIRMPLDESLSEQEILKNISIMTKENVPIIKGVISKIDAKFGTKSGDNVKDLDKVLEKSKRPSLLAKKPWHKISHIRDSYRFKTVIDDFNDVPAIFDELLNSGIKLVKIDTNKLFAPGDWGWRIIAFDLRMPNGQLVEWYLPLKELEAEKKARGHLIFEEWRNKTAEEIHELQDEFYDAMRLSYQNYDDAFQASLDRLGVDRQRAEASWTKAESSLLEAARKSLNSSGMIVSSNESLGVQTPASVLKDRDPSDLNRTALEEPSSISANVLSATDDDLLSTVNIDEIRANINQDEDLFPVGLLDGEAQTVTARQLLADIDREDAMVDTLSRCPI